MSIRTLTAALAAAFIPALVHAQDTVAPAPVAFQPMLGMMGTFGGSKLADAIYTDGTSSAVTAGGTVYFYGGGVLRTTSLPIPLSLVGTVGYHVSRAGAENGDFTFERIPFELIGMVDAIPNKLRFGAGLRYDTSVNLSAHGVVSQPALKFNDASGAVIQAEWMMGPHFGLVARYVNIRYRFDAGNSQVGHVDGSQGGIGLNWYL